MLAHAPTRTAPSSLGHTALSTLGLPTNGLLRDWFAELSTNEAIDFVFELAAAGWEVSHFWWDSAPDRALGEVVPERLAWYCQWFRVHAPQRPDLMEKVREENQARARQRAVFRDRLPT